MTPHKCSEEEQAVLVLTSFHSSDTIRSFPFVTHTFQLHTSIRGTEDFLQGDAGIKGVSPGKLPLSDLVINPHTLSAER